MWHQFECCGWSVYSPFFFPSVGRPLMRWCGLIRGSSSLHVEVSSGYTQNLKLLYLWWISVFEAWKYCGMLQIKSAVSLLMSSLAPCPTASVIRVWMWMGECGICLKHCEWMIVEENFKYSLLTVPFTLGLCEQQQDGHLFYLKHLSGIVKRCAPCLKRQKRHIRGMLGFFFFFRSTCKIARALIRLNKCRQTARFAGLL